jgi:hypothetical protein
MGARHGFTLPTDHVLDTDNSPSCYVLLKEGNDLWHVIAQLLSIEPKVRTVNLNYVDR